MLFILICLKKIKLFNMLICILTITYPLQKPREVWVLSFITFSSIIKNSGKLIKSRATIL